MVVNLYTEGFWIYKLTSFKSICIYVRASFIFDFMQYNEINYENEHYI